MYCRIQKNKPICFLGRSANKLNPAFDAAIRCKSSPQSQPCRPSAVGFTLLSASLSANNLFSAPITQSQTTKNVKPFFYTSYTLSINPHGQCH